MNLIGLDWIGFNYGLNWGVWCEYARYDNDITAGNKDGQRYTLGYLHAPSRSYKDQEESQFVVTPTGKRRILQVARCGAFALAGEEKQRQEEGTSSERVGREGEGEGKDHQYTLLAPKTFPISRPRHPFRTHRNAKAIV